MLINFMGFETHARPKHVHSEVVSQLCATLAGVAETGVCAWLRFRPLSLQDVLNQVFNTKVFGASRTLHTVD